MSESTPVMSAELMPSHSPAEPADAPLIPESTREFPTTIIRPTQGWRAIDLREVWRFRGLLFALTWREITIRYKQTILGATWAIIQPLMTTGVFAVLFGLLMGRGKEPTVPGIPYVVSTFCAMLPWQLFAHSLNQSGMSLVTHNHMISKIYFPRLILPFSAVLAALVDFAVGLVALVGLMFWYGVSPSWSALLLPLFMLLAVTASLAAGLWLSALTAIYRDFRYVIPFIAQFGMFVSPVVYAASSLQGRLPDWALVLYGLNPMVSVIEGFRWALLGTASPPGLMFLASLAMTFVFLVGGMFYFRRMERTFADVI
jgi:lipopolysaccharide transport system permease protein